MAPLGAPRGRVTPGLDLGAVTSGFLLFLLVLPYIHSLPLKTDNTLPKEEKYYKTENIRCLLCPPGNYVERDCISPDTLGTCVMCHAGRTYSEHPIGISHCLTCTRCRDDQEEVSPCTITKNTVCRCKKGTFCPPDHPCEICLTCRTSCTPHLEIQAPCNSTSDTQCGPPNSFSVTKAAIIGIVVVLIFIIAVVCFCCLKKSTDGQDCRLWTKISNVSFCKHNRTSEEDDTASHLLLTDNRLAFKEGTNREERDTIIIKSFDCFVEQVPVKEFDKFMRKLELSINQIDRAKINNPGDASSQCYAMLLQWHQESIGDVNVLLKTLRDMKMRKVAHDITEKLIADQLYVRQTQS